MTEIWRSRIAFATADGLLEGFSLSVDSLLLAVENGEITSEEATKKIRSVLEKASKEIKKGLETYE